MQLQNIVYFLVWAGLIFLMMRFGCGAHIMGHGHGRGTHSDESWTPPDKAVDPVCGMTIQTGTAKSTVDNGHVYYFCSPECRAKFEAAPASYAKPQHEGHRHGC